ncbi:MAG: tetratricopeptide repeat protein [Bacteroidia bacterium]
MIGFLWSQYGGAKVSRNIGIQAGQIGTQQDNPHYTFHLEIAKKLEPTHPDSAIFHYKEALKYDPNSFEASYSLGGLYYQKAVEYTKLYNQASTPQEQKKYYDLLRENLEAALPWWEKAHILNPNHKPLIQQLIKICEILELQEKVAHYQSALEKAASPPSKKSKKIRQD